MWLRLTDPDSHISPSCLIPRLTSTVMLIRFLRFVQCCILSKRGTFVCFECLGSGPGIAQFLAKLMTVCEVVVPVVISALS